MNKIFGGKTMFNSNNTPFTMPVISDSAMRDSREGRSGMSRKTYMESKELHRANALEFLYCFYNVIDVAIIEVSKFNS